MYGYHGQALRIDVATCRSERIRLDEAELRQSLGGSGLAAWLLLREQRAWPESTHPLAPETALVFAFSPLVGSPLTTSAKFAVASWSPLTRRFNDSLVSSGFAIAGKQVGADALVLVGRAAELSVLVIDDGQVRLESAADLAGLSCDETERRLKQRLGTDYRIAVIGPAGENLVRFASVSHDGRHAGRGGNGAVLGSKNLKAVAVRGSQRCAWHDPAALTRYARQLSEKSFGPATAKYRELGTAANMLAFNRLATLPTRNFQQGSFEGAEQLAPETMGEARAKTRASCVACTIGCEHLYTLVDSKGEQPDAAVRVEYENLFALGPLLGINDPDVVLAASQLCDRMGLDTISMGGTLAWMMECGERGLLPDELAEADLRFGDGQAVLRAIRMTGEGEGIGKRLAEGSRSLAEPLGGEALACAVQVKGLELPGYEPRAMQTMALGFAVGARGADHNRSGAYEADFSDRVDRFHVGEDSVAEALAAENRAAIMDSLILCKFLRGVFDDFFEDAAEMLRLVTGWQVDAAELQRSANRILSAKKLFNIRAGWTPDEDTLPARFLQSDRGAADSKGGPQGIDPVALRQAIRVYNRGRGWTDDGWLPDEQIAAVEPPR